MIVTLFVLDQFLENKKEKASEKSRIRMDRIRRKEREEWKKIQPSHLPEESLCDSVYRG